MYKVELLQSDILQQQSIDRRKRLDDERKRRIFDPKIRVMGIDVKSLEQQILLKNDKKRHELERDLAFDRQNEQTVAALTHMQFQVDQSRIKNQMEIQKFRQDHQKKTETREYDLNDPNSLKKVQLVPSDNKHASNLMSFDGQDEDNAIRVAHQKHQMRAWAVQGMWEKELKKKKDEEEKNLYEQFQQNVANKGAALEKATQEAKLAMARQDFLFNQALVEEKKRLQAQTKQTETDANFKELLYHVNGTFLTEDENSESAKARQAFKHMDAQSKKDILLIQKIQCQERQLKKQRESETEREWAIQETVNNQLSKLLEEERLVKQREYNIALRRENEKIARCEKERRDYIDKVLYTNQPQPSYFDQFNTSSR
jgi:hypothetical protein